MPRCARGMDRDTRPFPATRAPTASPVAILRCSGASPGPRATGSSKRRASPRRTTHLPEGHRPEIARMHQRQRIVAFDWSTAVLKPPWESGRITKLPEKPGCPDGGGAPLPAPQRRCEQACRQPDPERPRPRSAAANRRPCRRATGRRPRADLRRPPDRASRPRQGRPSTRRPRRRAASAP